ncbi:NurA 5'-3' nuclease [Desulfurobacterium pacificum]|uniref:NurA 5'-3' nuclease n=1 Tax=Desulfurobacterium pacificum TaxID=240166 RepID=A0ABY1N6Y7_9BACT|nr:DNA double-strand break repair nuclease NurA [Desulfurobacterium pacificum]SMP02055.1 NurA 5'-3' nuclease [Desulfurobacterium pacificum]
MRITTFLLQKAKSLTGISESSERLGDWESRVLGVWNSDFEVEEGDFSLAAVDGSGNKRAFSGYCVYAVGAVAVEFFGDEKRKEVFIADVDVLKPEEFSDARMRILMGILENKVALSVIDEVDYLLLDGSLLASFIKPAVFVGELNDEERKKVEGIFKEVRGRFSLTGIDAKSYYRELEKIFEGISFAAASGYLEYLEYLYSLELLLERGKGKLISVSKRSNSRNYGFDRFFPDAAVLNHLPYLEGYSTPLKVSISKEVKFQFPEMFEEVFRDFEFSVFFYKERNCPAFKVETLVPLSEALKVIRRHRTGGYPFPLKMAHDNVKIGKKDMEKVIYALKHRGVSGREALGE